MKRILLLLICFGCVKAMHAQTPDLINYQGVIRDGAGLPLVNRNVSVQFQIRQGNPAGNPVYTETQSASTNMLGLFSTQIGRNDPAGLAQVNWMNGPFFLAVSVDTAAGSDFMELGTQMLGSTPYAFNARSAEHVATSYTNNVLSIAGNSYTLSAGDQTVTIQTTGSNVQVTGTYPSFTLNSTATLTHNDGQLSISDGNTVDIVPTVTIQNNILRVGPSTNTVALPAVQNTSLTGAGITTVSGSFPNYTIDTSPAVITGSGATQVNAAFPSYTIFTPTVAVTATGASTIGGTYPNYVVNTATPDIQGSGATSVSGGFPNYVINTPTPAFTSAGITTITGTYPNYVVTTPSAAITGSGMVQVSTGPGLTYAIHVPTLSYNNVTGAIASGTNVTDITPLVTYTNNILTIGPSNNSVSISGSPWTQGGSTVSLVTGASNVGIGTTTPSARLEIDAGAGSTALKLQNARDIIGSAFPLEINANTGGQTYGTNTYGRILRLNNTTQSRAYDLGIGATGNFFITAGNNYSPHHFVMNGSGFVGLGTDNPTEHLQVESPGNTQLSVISASNATSELWFGYPGFHYLGGIIYNNNNNSFNVLTNNTPNRLFIDANGQVALGTTSVGGFNFNIYGSGNNSSMRFFHNGTTGLGFVISNNNSGTSILSYENTPMYFGNDGINLMSLQTNGELRIGTNTSAFSNNALLVSRAGAFDNRVTITGGDNSNTYGGILSFAENLNQVGGLSIKLDAAGNRLWFTSDLDGNAPVMSIGGYGGSATGVAIGSSYASTDAPVNGLAIQGRLAVGNTAPAYAVHIEEPNAGAAAFFAQNTYTGTTDGTAIYGYSQNGIGYGYGGQFFGGYHGILAQANGNSTSYLSSTFGARLLSYNQMGANYGVYSSASGGSYVYGIYAAAAGGSIDNYAGYFSGNVHIAGLVSKGAGTFKIDHPQDPLNKYLVHSFVESPDMMNVYNGNVITDNNGYATVQLPSYFEAENIDYKYQLTVIGQFAQAIVSEEISNNAFQIRTDKPNVKVSWQVTGVRNDEFARQHRIVPEVEKTGEERGKYLHPELYGLPASAGIHVPRVEEQRTGGRK